MFSAGSHEPRVLAQSPAIESLIVFLIIFLKEKAYVPSAHPRARIVEVHLNECPAHGRATAAPGPALLVQVMAATFQSAQSGQTPLSSALFDRLQNHPLAVQALGPALMDIYIGRADCACGTGAVAVCRGADRVPCTCVPAAKTRSSWIAILPSPHATARS